MRPLLTAGGVVAVVIALAVGAAAQYAETPSVDDVPISINPNDFGQGIRIGPGTETPIRVRQAPQVASDLPPLKSVELEVVARQLDEPLFVTSPPGDPRLFVLEKPGSIKVIVDGKVLEQPFLDLTDQIDSDGAELGFLGMTFHPAYEWNSKFYVTFTDLNGDMRLVQYRVSQLDPNRADRGSARELLFIDQPQSFHQGGMLEFGTDGYMYVSAGDGGGIGDQYRNGQNPETLMGTILRLDVDNGDPYAIPPDNPFVNGGGAPEVWAYGLRNPWRVAIDHPTGHLYIADVGQAAWEEVNVVALDRPGLNFGWPIREANTCFEAETCELGFIEPVEVISHKEACAIIGGYVYRGKAIPELDGTYFYGDWCRQWVRSFRFFDGRALDRYQWIEDWGKIGPILSFGVDYEGELYIATQDGNIFKMVARR